MTPNERICDNCGRWIEHNEVRYIMRVTLLAEPFVDLHQPEEMEVDDVRREIEELVRRMEAMTDEEANEATDQVHENYEYILCPECRAEVHDRMKRKSQILGPED